jgi:mRNA-degrading endonuclease toxin of MazEF toxin-antitoxin module
MEISQPIMAKIHRGDVVIVGFAKGKLRPAIIVQSDHNNGRLLNTILVQVTSNTRLVGKEPTQVLIDVTTADGKQSGLKLTSAAKCENIATHPVSDIRHVIGRLLDSIMRHIHGALKQSDGALKQSLSLP